MKFNILSFVNLRDLESLWRKITFSERSQKQYPQKKYFVPFLIIHFSQYSNFLFLYNGTDFFGSLFFTLIASKNSLLYEKIAVSYSKRALSYNNAIFKHLVKQEFVFLKLNRNYLIFN
jgi:hypothetical protein